MSDVLNQIHSDMLHLTPLALEAAAMAGSVAVTAVALAAPSQVVVDVSAVPAVSL